MCLPLQAVEGPWYQHVFVSLGLLVYIAIVLFFVSSGICCNVFLFWVCVCVCACVHAHFDQIKTH